MERLLSFLSRFWTFAYFERAQSWSMPSPLEGESVVLAWQTRSPRVRVYVSGIGRVKGEFVSVSLSASCYTLWCVGWRGIDKCTLHLDAQRLSVSVPLVRLSKSPAGPSPVQPALNNQPRPLSLRGIRVPEATIKTHSIRINQPALLPDALIRRH